jgi:hypothetical protein
VGLEAVEQRVVRGPVVRRIVGVGRVPRSCRRDLVPAQRVPDDVDAEVVEDGETLVEERHRGRAGLEPGLVLDAVPDRRRGCRRRGCEEQGRRERDEDRATTHHAILIG